MFPTPSTLRQAQDEGVPTPVSNKLPHPELVEGWGAEDD